VFSTGSEGDQIQFTRLEAEFEQWWEMATVLIEVASTGQETSPDTTTTTKRERRITMASEEAKLASRALSLRKLSSSTPRKASLPDPEDLSANTGLSPPRGSPDQWRASTGRQDLSKRQLEVLRTMLRTPVSPKPSRPSINGRQLSMLSISSTNTPSKSNPTSDGTPTSGVKFPSPPSSNYIVPSGSFPTPGMANGLAKGGKGKSGLVGLKDFLRSLKGNATPTRSKAGVKPIRQIKATPISPIKSKFGAISPTRMSFEEVFQPSTTKSSFSVLGPSDSNTNTSAGLQSAPLKRIPSPEKGAGGKRPSLKNIFRSSSGNWSDLVKGTPVSTPPVPPVPTPFIRNTSTGSTNSSEVNEVSESKGVLKTTTTTTLTSPMSSTFQHSEPSSISWDEGEIVDNVGENTVRPARRPRILGLGLGTPTSPISPTWQFSAPKPGLMRSQSQYHQTSGQLPVSPTSSIWPKGMMDSPSLGSINDGEGGQEGEVVVALTPENLPVLLDYLRQCEGKLGEWALRVEGGLT